MAEAFCFAFCSIGLFLIDPVIFRFVLTWARVRTQIDTECKPLFSIAKCLDIGLPGFLCEMISFFPDVVVCRSRMLRHITEHVVRTAAYKSSSVHPAVMFKFLDFRRINTWTHVGVGRHFSWYHQVLTLTGRAKKLKYFSLHDLLSMFLEHIVHARPSAV